MESGKDLVVSRSKYLLKRVKGLLKRNDRSLVTDLRMEIRALEDSIHRLENGKPDVKRTEYTCETDDSYDGGTVEKHESFGMMSFSRVTGGTKLFGSHIDTHEHFMKMAVFRAQVEHSLDQDWYSASSRVPIVDIYLSAAQFAEALTSMNVGDGVPCTINAVEGIPMQRVPEEMLTENVKIKAGFKKQISGLVSMMEKAHSEIEELVESKATVSKGRAREVVSIMEVAVRELKLNAPYVVDAFQESAEKVVTHAKSEIEAFTNITLRNAGMEHLRLQADVKPKLIREGGEDLPGESQYE